MDFLSYAFHFYFLQPLSSSRFPSECFSIAYRLPSTCFSSYFQDIDSWFGDTFSFYYLPFLRDFTDFYWLGFILQPPSLSLLTSPSLYFPSLRVKLVGKGMRDQGLAVREDGRASPWNLEEGLAGKKIFAWWLTGQALLNQPTQPS